MDGHIKNKKGDSNGIGFIEGTKIIIDGEHYLPNHCFFHIKSGSLTISDGTGSRTFKKGEFVFNMGNRLAKIKKSPDPDGLFRSIVVFMDKELLQKFSKNYQVKDITKKIKNSVFSMKPNALLRNYFDSLLPYFDIELPESLVTLKKNEGIMLLINEYPELANILFNFSVPGKIDLEGFMNQNFKYNTKVKSYAYLTGRSLATFKRDFQKVFNTSPNRWLQQKRLEEAYYMIKENGQKPSEVYMEVGFETLSHFSYSFKQFFGVNPSSI